MNYGSKGTRRALTAITSKKIRRKTGICSGIFNLSILSICCIVILVASLALGVYRGIIDSAPNIGDLEFSPTGVATTILDSEGNVIQTLIKSGSNREIVEYDQIPKDLVNAFVAIEDSRFWEHHGIDSAVFFAHCSVPSLPALKRPKAPAPSPNSFSRMRCSMEVQSPTSATC